MKIAIAANLFLLSIFLLLVHPINNAIFVAVNVLQKDEAIYSGDF